VAVELDDLARHRDVIPLLAAWHVREWQHLYPEWTVEAAIAELEATTSGAVPHTIVAFDGRGRSAADVAGSVSIIDDDELDGFEHVRPWLASVYVRPPARRAGLGTRLVTAAVEFASGAGIDRLHLLTADECEFYARLGWRRVADADKNGRHVTVMRIDTDAHAPRRALAADWCTNPWFRCAYSYLRADGTPADRDVLAAAAAPGLMLAGEAASRDHPGTAHGAWFSGERAAREVCATAPARVLVVGAGLAGIAAARVARECGAAVTVLEATSRIGGRAASSRRLGGPVNVGAAWMHGTTGHPLFDVFSRRGRRIDADTFRDTTTFVAGRGELAGAELASLQRMSGEITRRIAAATRSAACGSTVAEVLDPAIDDVAVDGVSAAVLQSWFAASTRTSTQRLPRTCRCAMRRSRSDCPGPT
jgi:GNAT superfamily N-acetyltransferase